MRIDDKYISGIGVFLPERASVTDAIESGAVDEDRARSTGITSVCVSKDLYPPEMAVRAGRDALRMAGEHDKHSNVHTLLHAYIDYQGAPYWDAAPHVALNTVGPSVPAYDIRQASNGGMAAIELGRQLLDSKPGSVMVTTGDRFRSDRFSRWNAAQDVVLGDGGTALVLSSEGGFAKIVSIATCADNTLESEMRGAAFKLRNELHVDYAELSEEYQKSGVSLREHVQRMGMAVRTALQTALGDAKMEVGDVAYTAPIVSTLPRMREFMQHLMHVDEDRSTWEFGRTTGHLGAGDNIAGFHWLVTSGLLKVGDRALLMGTGAGFTATCAIIELTTEVASL